MNVEYGSETAETVLTVEEEKSKELTCEGLTKVSDLEQKLINY